jgi:hypothetical protein
LEAITTPQMQSQNHPSMSQSQFDKYDKAFSFRGDNEKQALTEDQHHVSPLKSPLHEFSSGTQGSSKYLFL